MELGRLKDSETFFCIVTGNTDHEFDPYDPCEMYYAGHYTTDDSTWIGLVFSEALGASLYVSRNSAEKTLAKIKHVDDTLRIDKVMIPSQFIDEGDPNYDPQYAFDGHIIGGEDD